MDDRHRVVVDVDDPRVGGDGMGDLVDVALGGQAGADVEELPDPCVGEEPHGAAEERAVLQRRARAVGHHGVELLHGLTVDREVVLAAESVVVHPRDVRGGGVDALRKRSVLAHSRVLLGTSASWTRS